MALSPPEMPPQPDAAVRMSRARASRHRPSYATLILRMEQLSFDSAPSVFTVTEVTAAIHRLLTRSFDDVRITGEISGYKVWTSGHAYFTLKDSGAQLRCVLFKNTLRYLRFKPNDGLAVVARGSIEVRQERGEYQLIVSSLEPQGSEPCNSPSSSSKRGWPRKDSSRRKGNVRSRPSRAASAL